MERIEQVAPNQASLDAARRLLKPAKWPALRVDAPAELLWGECQGSGVAPYQMAVALHDLGAKCSCPSRKFPCKHALALMWWRATDPDRFAEGEPPDWVMQWLARRRGAAKGAPGAGAGTQDDGAAGGKSLRRAESSEQRAKKQEHNALQRARHKEEREQSILRGLDELDVWLGDQFERGLAGFAERAIAQCRIASQRLADAKATSLAARIDALPSLYFAKPEMQRIELLLREFGGLHLLAEAYRRQQDLPAPLREDVRRLIGWSRKRAELLEDPQAQHVAGSWIVLGVTRTAQPDRLLRCETWLANADPAARPRYGVLVDFVPQTASREYLAPAAAGEQLRGELVFHPSAVPASAVLGEATRLGRSEGYEPSVPPAPGSLTELLADFEQCLAQHPWLPPRLAGATLEARRDEEGAIWFCDADAVRAVPALNGEPGAPGEAALAQLIGLGAIEVHGVFDGESFLPLAARTPLGPWWHETA